MRNQETLRSSPISRSSGAFSLQASIANGNRLSKWYPLGNKIGLGDHPLNYLLQIHSRDLITDKKVAWQEHG